jgi:type II secretory pathway pseudopilin PulG
VELLVVIAVFAILTAIVVPIGQRLRENNRTSTCEAQLSRIAMALKLYFLDEGGVPPIGVEGTLAGGPTGTTVDLKQWPGLQMLFYLDYLPSRSSLHCPRHVKTLAGGRMDTDSPEYYHSYLLRDSQAKPSGSPLKQYKYMPYRWATATGYPNDYRRQLTRNIKQVTMNATDYLVTSSSTGLPPDDTIITWCDYHARTYRINGHGQYIALYWDGSVQLLDEEVFRDTAFGPDEAWQVRTTDIAH